MKSIKTLIVDDSSFTIAVIKKMLAKKGITEIEVAHDIKTALSKATTFQPDLITMDYTLQDGNGIVCSREIIATNGPTNIVMISAMKDAEIIEDAHAAGVNGFLQKPIEEQELFDYIDQTFTGESFFSELKNNYESIFTKAFLQNIQLSIDKEATLIKDSQIQSTIKKSDGICVSIGIIGKFLGRIVIDSSEETANRIIEKFDIPPTDAMGKFAFFSELTNVIAGNACSKLNKINRDFSLRVTPPTIFRGNDMIISLGNMDQITYKVKTEYGKIYMNVAFQKGETKWM